MAIRRAEVMGAITVLGLMFGAPAWSNGDLFFEAAEIPVVEEPGPFKDRVDTAWSEISYGVVRAVSIGFRPIKYAYKDDGGNDFQEIEIYELSSVSIPAVPRSPAP